ncbi:M20 family metallopeptidase [Neorhizobium petrolearium]|uniref:M20 family metallopeptidase n=1 Tax=Neorhizobium petrolearium TaxID=515361 RepID=A0ABY8M887_9HYPH|nr:M20 family metallopeptidase [Neorhizobium petrolearium]MCC2610519.1 M20 family metallopeptidase [Neorhizobium petrolearium]WGI70657.1 M20 family metallopeptidase [Neorhizobium petrolearium]
MTLAISAQDIDDEALIEELKRWVEIETPTSNAEAVNRLVDRVEILGREAGLDTERLPGTLGFGDILAVRSPRPAGSNEKTVLILAHLDTVHAVGVINNQLPLRQEGDKLYGPGIYDMKSGALMALEAMKLAVRKGSKMPIDLIFVPDEEMGSLSSRTFMETAAKNAGYTLVVEPARDGGKVVVARKGVAMYDITVQGRAAHAGARPQDGRSAIRAAARLVLELEALNDTDRGVTVTVGTIQGGTGRNTVPAECRLQVDVRVPNDQVAEEITGKIEAMKPVDPDITFEIAGKMNRPPFAQSEEGKRLFEAAAKIASDLGIALEGMATGGGSDGNFTSALGVPTLDGLGADGAGPHTFNEHIFLSSVAPRTALLANLMISLEAK